MWIKKRKRHPNIQMNRIQMNQPSISSKLRKNLMKFKKRRSLCTLFLQKMCKEWNQESLRKLKSYRFLVTEINQKRHLINNYLVLYQKADAQRFLDQKGVNTQKLLVMKKIQTLLTTRGNKILKRQVLWPTVIWNQTVINQKRRVEGLKLMKERQRKF